MADTSSISETSEVPSAIEGLGFELGGDAKPVARCG